MSLRVWIYAVLAVVALFLLRQVKQRVSQATRDRDFRLEQRRRYGIPDSDKRPFKEAAAAVEESRRAATPVKSNKSPQHRSSALSAARLDVPNGDGLRRRHDSPLGRRMELGKVERQPIARQLSRTALRALDQAQRGMTQTSGYQSPTYPQDSRAHQLSHQHSAESPRHAPLRQPGSHHPDRRVASRSGVPSKLGKRGHDESEEDDIEEREERGKRSRRDEEQEDERPQPTRRRKRDDESEEEHEEGRHDRRIIQRRKIARREEIPSDASTGVGDQDEDEIDQGSQADELDRLDRGKKRYIDDVDAESTVSFRRQPKRGKTSQSVSDAASTASGRWDDDPSMPDGDEDPEEEEEFTLRTRRGGYSRRPQRQSLKTPRRTPRKTLKQEILEPKRRIGDEWVDRNGMRWKLGDDGITRKAVVVKEIRKKYNMPEDSKHPDRNITHKVLVEKWLTDEEIAQAQKNKQLGWQESDTEAEPTVAAAHAPTPTEVNARNRANFRYSTAYPSLPQALRMNRSLYHLPGTASPIRSSLSNPSLLRTVTPGRHLLSRAGSPASSIGSPRIGSPALRGSPSISRLRGREITEKEDRERAKALATTLKEQVAMKEGKELPQEVATPTQESKSTALPAAQITASLPAPSAATSTGEANPAPSFSFGQPPSTSTSELTKDTSKTTSTPFSLAPAPGSRSFADKPAPSPLFSSAAPASVTHNIPAETAPSKPAPFAFGVPSTNGPASASDSKAASSTAPAPFSFGSSAPAGPSSKPATSAPTPFAFGSTTATTKAHEAPKPASSPAPPSFMFGAPKTTPAAPSHQAATANPFGNAPSGAPIFGSTTPVAGNSTTAPSGFMSAAPKTSAPSAPSFSFGSSGPIPLGNSSARSSPAPAPNMPIFGAPSPATSSNPFGKSSSPALASSPAPSMSAPSTTAGFNFGQTAPPGGQQGMAFSFGASGPVGSGATTPGGRQIRGNRRTKPSGQSMSPAPSPGPTAASGGFSFSMGK